MTTLPEALAYLFGGVTAGGPALLCSLPDGLHLKVVLRGERRLIGAWSDVTRLSPQACEEIGEDAGFYDPVVKPWACAESPRAFLIVEGFRGELCDHDFGLLAHYDAKNEFGNLGHCQKCRVLVQRAHARRGRRETCTYDRWELRTHIWQRWLKRGPVPGALQPQAHHTVGKGLA